MFSFFKRKKEVIDTKKEYILWVTKKEELGGYGSYWYGWSRNLVYTHEEALMKKEEIKDHYFDVEIVKVEEIKF